MLILTLLPGERVYLLGQAVIEYSLQDGDTNKPVWKVAPYTQEIPLICDNLAALADTRILPIKEQSPITIVDGVEANCLWIDRRGRTKVGFNAPKSIRILREGLLINEQARRNPQKN